MTEGDTVVAKPMKKDVSVAVKTPDASHVRHVDKSFPVPPGVVDFKVWSLSNCHCDGQVCRFELVLLRTLSSWGRRCKDCTLHLMDCWNLRHTCRQRPAEPGGRFWLVCQGLRMEAQAEGISTKDQVNP